MFKQLQAPEGEPHSTSWVGSQQPPPGPTRVAPQLQARPASSEDWFSAQKFPEGNPGYHVLLVNW